ncbi:MAG: alkyl hydroperoxide reductase [Candidatus Omnitrophica bacterium CG11_big_fil_rev_8_21_14_0_20_63_9]|nr:MAG: alkyl hydroperoxide reductase [Candidatus Omnitrophica bacterium CG11_big_fil_rev_8_21_14_0_20_63_9]
MRQRSGAAAAGWVVAGALFAGCGSTGVTEDWHRIEPPVPAPPFTLAQLDDGELKLSDLQGRIVIMEFWATWCEPCRFSLPSLEVIYKRYRSRGVTVLLLNQDEPPDAVRAWLAGKFTAPVLLDARGLVGNQYGVEGIPQLFIIDQQGRIIFMHAGYGGGLERNLKLILDELLKPTHA